MLISAEDFAKQNNITKQRCYYLLRMGKIKNAFKIGDVWKVLI